MNNFSGDTDCVALWRFESGALTADSIGGNTLTYPATIPDESTSDYQEGSCAVDFSSGKYLQITDANLDAGFPFRAADGTPGEVMTVCFWFKAAAWPAYYILAKYDTSGKRTFAIATDIGGDYKLRFIMGYNAGNSGESFIHNTVLSPGTWYHAAVVFSNTERDIFGQSTKKVGIHISLADGTTVGSDIIATSTNSINIEDAALTVGSRTSGQDAFDGLCDEIVVFKRVLTLTEIDDIRAGTYSPGAITAEFTADVTSGYAPLEVDFTDLSSGDDPITTWEWDIDNDSTTDYTTQNPTHTYSTPGVYSVKLTAGDGSVTGTLTKTDYIEVLDPDQPLVTEDIERGNLDSTSISISGSGTSWSISATPRVQAGNCTQFFFKVTNANGNTITFNINLDAFILSAANMISSGWKPCWTTTPADPTSWTYFSTVTNPSGEIAQFSNTFASDTIYVAFQPAVLPSYVATKLASLSGITEVASAVSFGGDDYQLSALTATTNEVSTAIPSQKQYGFKVGTGVADVVCFSGIHAGEDIGDLSFFGFVDWLLSTDTDAVRLRDDFTFNFYPMVNPSGRYGGHYRWTYLSTYDPNRIWASGSFALDEVVNKMHTAVASDTGDDAPDVLLDFHGFGYAGDYLYLSASDSINLAFEAGFETVHGAVSAEYTPGGNDQARDYYASQGALISGSVETSAIRANHYSHAQTYGESIGAGLAAIASALYTSEYTLGSIGSFSAGANGLQIELTGSVVTNATQYKFFLMDGGTPDPDTDTVVRDWSAENTASYVPGDYLEHTFYYQARNPASTSSVSATDTVKVGQSAAVSDGLSFGDSSQSVAHYIAAAVDSLGLGEASEHVAGYIAAHVDAVVLSDLIAAIFHGKASISETLSFSDIAVTAISGAAAVVDSILLGDQAAALGKYLRNSSDILSMSDSASGLAHFVSALLDALTFVDSATLGTTGASAGVSDALTLSDQAGSIQHFVVTINETLSLSDATDVLAKYLAAVVETLGLSEILTIISEGVNGPLTVSLSRVLKPLITFKLR